MQANEPSADQPVGPGDPLVDRLIRVRAEVDAAATAAGRAPVGGAGCCWPPRPSRRSGSSPRSRPGITLIGENRVQEVVAKAEELADVPHEMHFIGHLQTNKINQLLGRISCLQTLDSVELAGKLDAGWRPGTRQLDVLIQVNVSGEESKSGVAARARPRPARRTRAIPAADRPRLHDDRPEFAGSRRRSGPATGGWRELRDSVMAAGDSGR